MQNSTFVSVLTSHRRQKNFMHRLLSPAVNKDRWNLCDSISIDFLLTGLGLSLPKI